MPRLVPQYRRLPSTAIAFLSDNLLAAANGSTIDIYDVQLKTLICSCAVFDSVRIHGIVAQLGDVDSRCIEVLVFGSKQWTVIRVHLDNALVEPSTVFYTEDWIKAGHWVQDDKQMWQVALALAHNQVLVMDSTHGNSIYNVQCAERCILYAAALYGATMQTLVIAAGTVFNKVLVWDAWTKDTEAQVRVQLSGHEGVVFGVRFSKDGRRIMSTSDDRSVRVWNLDEKCAEAVLYGHGARVWSCVEVGGDWLVSASEDGTCRVWRSGETEDVWRLCPKNVWAVAAHRNGCMVAAACGDGAVCVWTVGGRQRIEQIDDLDTITLPGPEQTLNWPDRDMDPASGSKEREFIRGFALTWDSALVVTNHGHILRHSTANNSWHVVAAKYGALSGYAMVAAESKAGKVAAVGMRDGTVLLVCGNSIRSAQLHTCSVQWLTVMQRSDNVYDVITVDNSGDIVWSLVTWDAVWQVVARIERPTAGMRVASAAVSHDGQWLVIGSATGSVYVYKHGDVKTIDGLRTDTATVLRVACVWPQAHGRHTVSAMSVDVDAKGNVRIVSGGRDGWVRTFSMLDSIPVDAAPDSVCVGDVVLHCTSHVQVTRGWIEQLLCVDGRLLAVTFFRKRLELVDVEAAHIVVSTVCAGGAKLWQVVVGSAEVRIGFVKSGLLRTVCAPLSQSAPIMLATGISATDIRAVCAIDVQVGGHQMHVALLGGEDGHIRIIKCNDTQLDVLANVRRHRSVIRCIQSIPSICLDGNANRFVLSAGAGSELRCWRLDSSSSDDALYSVDWAQAPVLDDRDIRIMGIAVVHRELSIVWIAAVYSDAS
ncbi:WD repeat-containing protein 6, partial [Coemansia sp. RSA 1199]